MSEYKKTLLTTFRRRMLILALIFILFTSYLLLNLLKLQIGTHDYYKDKVYDQITTTSPLRADRGNIYDSSMNLLATTNTVWRVFISTRDIKKAEKETGIAYSNIISTGLSEILGISKTSLMDKIKKTSVLDVTVKNSVNKEKYHETLSFVLENHLEHLVFFESQSSRYYPSNTLAAHVLGFCGSDNQGLYGLEYYYDSILKGTDGYYLYAKDANGNALYTEYSDYVMATDGNSIVTTLDSYVQAQLEMQLETILYEHSVQNRVTGIVMDTETGAILAMATSSPFNPNSPYELDKISKEKLLASEFTEGSEEYKKYKTALMQTMWSNKAVSETYEPGSTFKIVTVSAALDIGAADINDRFSCHGYHTVGGWRIKCHKVKGHGSGFTLAYGLQMSCNPTMMQIAERIGASDFYSYIKAFGYLEKTGIDLPSEASTIFHKLENIGSTELATMSFGQRFKVSIINQLCAVAAVANGGKLVTPYVVEKVIDSDGNVVSQHEVEVKRQVVSSEVAKLVADVLEQGVSGEGGAKNAAVDGYKVAAKTGTSQKFDVLDANGNSYLRIGSTVAFAPSDEGGIAVIIVVDEPMSTVKYGSVVAAPYISALLDDVLPYLGYESNAETKNATVGNYAGLDIKAAIRELNSSNIKYQVIGEGDTVLKQTPSPGDTITYENSTVYLYTTDTTTDITVPSLVGLTLNDAIETAINSGLNIKINGPSSGTVVSQSLPYGALVERGEVITITTLILDYED